MSRCNFNQKLLSCKELLLLFSLFILPGIIAPPSMTGTEFNNPRFLALVIVTGLAEAGLILYLLTHIGERRLADYSILPLQPKNLLWALLSWFLIFPLLFVCALALSFILSRYEAGVAFALPPFRWSYTNYSLAPFALAACLVTGYAEELFYRAYLPGEFLRRGMPALPARLFPVFFFAAGHAYQGAAGFAAACLLGLYLTAVFRAAKNLHVPALAHGLYNFCVLLVSGLDFFTP